MPQNQVREMKVKQPMAPPTDLPRSPKRSSVVHGRRVAAGHALGGRPVGAHSAESQLADSLFGGKLAAGLGSLMLIAGLTSCASPYQQDVPAGAAGSYGSTTLAANATTGFVQKSGKPFFGSTVIDPARDEAAAIDPPASIPDKRLHPPAPAAVPEQPPAENQSTEPYPPMPFTMTAGSSFRATLAQWSKQANFPPVLVETNYDWGPIPLDQTKTEPFDVAVQRLVAGFSTASPRPFVIVNQADDGERTIILRDRS